MNQKSSRRQFVKGVIGSLGGMFVARLGGLFPEMKPLLAKQSSAAANVRQQSLLLHQMDVGELYSGFLLLPEGIDASPYVDYPSIGTPQFCGAGDGASPTVVSNSFKTVGELASTVDFPIYVVHDVSDIPISLVAKDIYATKYITGEIYSTTIYYHAVFEGEKVSEGQIFLWAYPVFPKPYPMWNSEPVEVDGFSFIPERVDFLPRPGLMSTSSQGFVFYWIEKDVLYNMIMEPFSNIQDAKLIVNRLVQI